MGATAFFNRAFFNRTGSGGWAREAGLAAAALAFGFGLCPLLIFFAGASLLGRYEGASVALTYHSVFNGLGKGSLACWTVVLGPYGLCLLFRGLRVWWRAGAEPA